MLRQIAKTKATAEAGWKPWEGSPHTRLRILSCRDSIFGQGGIPLTAVILLAGSDREGSCVVPSVGGSLLTGRYPPRLQECILGASGGEFNRYRESRRDRDIIRNGPPQKSEFTDRQLDKAVSYIQEKLQGKAAPKKKSKPAVEARKPAVSNVNRKKSRSSIISDRSTRFRLLPDQAA